MNHDEGIDIEKMHYFRESLLLYDIARNPISTVVERYQRIGINPKTGNNWKNLWILKGFIVPKRIITRAGWIVLFELTEEARTILRNKGFDFNAGNESIEHIFWKQKIAEYYEKQGYSVAIEELNADISIRKGSERIAVEIETGNSDHLYNIERNLVADFDSVICVPTNRYAQHKISQDIDKRDFGKKVKVVLAFKFDITLKSNLGKGSKKNGIP